MFRKLMIDWALKTLEKFLVKKIKIEALEAWVVGKLEPIGKMADVLTDKNPNNKEQLAKIWEEIKERFVKDDLSAAKAIILNKVKNKEVAEHLAELIQNVIDAQGLEDSGVLAERTD